MKVKGIVTALVLTTGATLLATVAEAQIAITGGTLVYFENGSTYNNAPVAGYLETAQGRIQSGNFTQAEALANPNLFEGISLGNTPVVLQMDGVQSYSATSFNLKATGTAYTPNGPVLFSNVPVVVQGTLGGDLSIAARTFTTPFGTFNNVGYIDEWNVTSGTFGTGSSITSNSGNTVSLAPNNFHFDPTHVFPAPPAPPAPPLTLQQQIRNSNSLFIQVGTAAGAEEVANHPTNNSDVPDPVAETGNNDTFAVAGVGATPAVPTIVRLIQEGRNPRVSRLVPMTMNNYENYELAQ